MCFVVPRVVFLCVGRLMLRGVGLRRVVLFQFGGRERGVATVRLRACWRSSVGDVLLWFEQPGWLRAAGLRLRDRPTPANCCGSVVAGWSAARVGRGVVAVV